MLAPRKTLHSTPLPVFRRALELVHATASDVLYDVGCGDGRCVVDAASRLGIHAVGIEIDAARAAAAARAAEIAGVQSLVRIVQGNALELELGDASIVFLFLITRGLRLLLPMLQRMKQRCRVVTYLYQIPGVAYSSRHYVQAKESSADAAFPLYIYEFPHQEIDDKSNQQEAEE